MSISASQFANDLYDEHIEEAAFLHELVITSVREPDFQWIDARDFEVRCEAHIDALSIGESAALARCVNVAADGSLELYVYASVILRQGRANEFAERISELVLGDAESLIALTSAITDHADDTELDYLSSQNLDACCSVTLLAIHRAIQQRNGSVSYDALNQALQARLNTLSLVQPQEGESTLEPTAESDYSALVELFGTVANSNFKKAHLLGARSDDELVKIESIINIQRFGQFSDKERLRQRINPGERGHAAIMIGAGAAYAHYLVAGMESSASEDLIQALALSGLPDVVRALVSALESDLAETAASALYCITGAELLENVFEEEVVDEDTLFEEERVAYKAGEKPTRSDGSAYGEDRSRISIDSNRWKQWLKTNQAQFVAGIRYRLGEPITPDSLVRTLRREQTPWWIRVYTEKELRCRYSITAAFDVSLTVRQQLRRLVAMRQSVATLQRIVPGKWYVDGQLMSGVE